jgi:hypothetical protein
MAAPDTEMMDTSLYIHKVESLHIQEKKKDRGQQIHLRRKISS